MPRESASMRERLAPFQVRRAGVFYALGAMMFVFAVATAVTGRPNYLRPQNVANILEQSSLMAILAVFAAVVLISGNFDLSVGSVGAFAGAVLLSTADEIGLPLALALALASAGAIGLFNGFVIQKLGINAFIVTLGTLVAVRGLVNVVTNGRRVSVESDVIKDTLDKLEGGTWQTPNVLWIGAVILVAVAVWLVSTGRREQNRTRVTIGTVAGILAAVSAVLAIAGVSFQIELAKTAWYAIVVTFAVAAVLRFTVLGRRLYATGGNAEAARLAGIRVDRYKMGALVASSLAAGVVGILFASKLGAITTQAMVGAEFTAITAAVIGGVALFGGSGSVVKAVVGVLILFGLANGFNVLNFPSVFQQVIEGAVIILAAAVYTIAERRQSTVRIEHDTQSTEPDPQRQEAA